MSGKLNVGIELKDGVTGKLTKILKSTQKTEKAFKRMNKSMSSMQIGGGLLIAKAVSQLASSFKEMGASVIKVTSDLEVMGMTLEVISSSATEAQALFRTMREWARTSPLETEDVVNSFVRLQAIGVNPTIEQMGTLGNVALIFGRQMSDVLDGFVGLNKRTLRQLGVDIDRTGSKAIIASGDMRIETEKTASAIRDGLVKVWEQRFPNALEKASQTLKAKTAIMNSNLFELKATIGELIKEDVKGFVDSLSTAFQSVREHIDPSKQSIEKMESKHTVALTKIHALQRRINNILVQRDRIKLTGIGNYKKEYKAMAAYNEISNIIGELKAEQAEQDKIRMQMEYLIGEKLKEQSEELEAQNKLKEKKKKAMAEEAALLKAAKEAEAYQSKMDKSQASYKYKLDLQKKIIANKKESLEIDKELAALSEKLAGLNKNEDDTDAWDKKIERMKETLTLASSISSQIAVGIADGERGIRKQLKGVLTTIVNFIEKQAIASIAMAKIDAAGKAGILGPAVFAQAISQAAAISAIAGAAKAGIAQFADGTNGPLQQPTLAEVGERGREIVALPAGAQVMNNQDSRDFSAKPTFNLYINGNQSVDQGSVQNSASTFFNTLRELERQGKIEKGLLR